MQRRLTPTAALNAHDHFHARLVRSFRYWRQTGHFDRMPRNIRQIPFIFEVEMMVVLNICVEIGARAIDDHLAQKPNFRELMKRIVNCCQRYTNTRRLSFGMKRFGGHVTINSVKQQVRERDPLACGPQTSRPKAFGRKGRRSKTCREFIHRSSYPPPSSTTAPVGGFIAPTIALSTTSRHATDAKSHVACHQSGRSQAPLTIKWARPVAITSPSFIFLGILSRRRVSI